MFLPKEELCTKVGNRLREIRLDKKLSIEKVALISEMEYSQISRIELGKLNTSLYCVYRISKTLDVSMSEIFKGLL